MLKNNKWLAVFLLLFCLPFIFISADNLYGRLSGARTEEKLLNVQVGDLIFRTNSYILSSGRYYYKSGIPGHVAIVVSEGVFNSKDERLGNIDVIESAMLNKSKRKIQAAIAINKAYENFGQDHGRRFLLKMHLNNEQKQKLLYLTGKQTGKPYRIFASRSSQASFNCTTFTCWAILEVTGFDLDTHAGYFVFPNDILRSPRFDKPGDRVRF